MNRFLTRSGIIALWITLIATILYWPNLKFSSSDENTLNVFAWGDILDPDVIARFQKKTGIHVNLNYYSSNEELIVKLRATQGAGYDLIIPSDYAVNVLAEENLLKPLDRSQLGFWPKIDPNLLNHFFDPDNRYSIPFEWEIYGFGIDADYFAAHPTRPSWKMIFENGLRAKNAKELISTIPCLLHGD